MSTLPLLERQDIQKSTDPGGFRRGEDYFKKRKVLSLIVRQTDNGGQILNSKVSGSNGMTYQQSIRLQNKGKTGYVINGECECPVSHNCKHVVAACLTYRQRQLAEAISDDHAMNQLASLIGSKKAQANEAVGDEFIVYVLKPNPLQHTLSVHFMVCRQLAKGGITRGRQIRLQQFSTTAVMPKFAVKSDLDISKALTSIEGEHWNDVPLRGEAGYQALTKILASGRCYWQKVSGKPMNLGERRPAALNLTPVDKRNVKLTIEIEPPADQVLQIAPAMYLDLECASIGHLQGITFTPHQWKLFNEMPLIPASRAKELRLEINKAFQENTPPPQPATQVQSIAESPSPVLQVFQKNIGPGNQTTFMRLRFRYDKYLIEPLPKHSMTAINYGDQLIHIRRARGFEERSLKRLTEEGFVSSVADSGGDMEYFCSLSEGALQSAQRWQTFSRELAPQLEQEGWEIEYLNNFSLRFHDMNDWAAQIEENIEEGNEWFDLRFDLTIGKRELPLLPIISEILTEFAPDEMPKVLTVSIGDGEFINIDSERIRPVCEILYELYSSQSISSNGTLRLGSFDALRLTELEQQLEPQLQWNGSEQLRQLGQRLRDFKHIKQVSTPKGFGVSLRDYQQHGLNWLAFLREYKLGGILADDMGLGKTVQTLAHLLNEKQQKRLSKPCLIIAPTSLMSNWRREAEKFARELSVLVLQGSERGKHFHKIPQYDIVLSTYPLLSRDFDKLLSHEYYYLVLDEAQNIKNPKSKAANTVRTIKTEHRLCLTGTPMENHLGELWAQFDFLMPGFLGNQRFFQRQFRTPIEKYHNINRREQLGKRVAPFMLRRKKIDVIKELPEKTEIIRSISLSSKQAALYESIRLSMEKQVQQAIASKGLARSHIMVLDALLKLRQICCDPRLLSLPQARTVNESAKLELLMDMLPELLEEGRRILLFSQFTTMLGIIEEHISAAGISYTKLTGQTRNRDDAIERFKNGEADVFLISLKAGGVGLNLTEADTVIHYDPWWNPAAEDQATDRAHRIGQNKAVFVYKLITENTLEEKILAMQERKQALMNGIYDNNSSAEVSLTKEDIDSLFAPMR